jgi:aspartyl-tRNA(Asn)/glutamyl-tRNA(Gln) amidotransferase subunit A
VPPNELAFLSSSEASELVRTGKVSPVELTRTILDRIGKLNPVLNAYITVTSEAALNSAREAESDIRHKKWRSPLHGIPIALKDLFDTAGVRTTAGSAVFKDRVPTEDADVVRLLKAPGAVLLGKTNMHEFAFGGSTLVTAFGGVHNPWKLDYVAGGSSGGSAAAVAAGLCFGALGSDTAGSIRAPAAYCGIVGLKPTFGLVSTTGVIPLSWSLDHVGPMTRTVEDTALMLEAITGKKYASSLYARPAKVRVGVARDFFFEKLESEIEQAVNRALSVLEKLNGGIRDVTIPARGQEELRATIRAAEAYAYHAEFIAKTPELYQAETLGRLRAGAEVSAVDYIHARQQLERTRRTVGDVFRTVDVIVTPTCPVNPPPISEFTPDRNGTPEFVARNIQDTSPFNVYGWPAISVPCGFTASGLPIGLQIAGPSGRDLIVLQVAHAYEQATDWHKRTPLLS